MASYKTRNGTKRNGTKRNEMEKSVKRVDFGAVRLRLGGLQADKQDTECTLAGLNPMLRVSMLIEGVWTPSNIEGVWTPSNAEAEGPSC